MPIKKISVTFDIPIAQFLGILAAGNSGMKIDVFGDEPKKRNGHAPLLLEKPGVPKLGMPRMGRGRKDDNGNPISARIILLRVLAASGEKTSTKVLTEALSQAGYASANTASSQLWTLQRVGHVKRIGKGEYQITAKGKQELTNG